ncbi:MAG: hypothetical protein RL226_1888 [Bacteroidota bacterium]|jgi:tRNA threonylcarbamoyladenosine biosynthesis protein TsaE
MKKVWRAETPDELGPIASELVSLLPLKGAVLMFGDMGVGKTTLMRALMNAFRSEDAVSSPTFSLVNEYRVQQGVVYHFDLYRIDSPEEALDIGIEEYLYADSLCFIEWPDRLGYLVPEEVSEIHIRIVDNQREITFVSPR